MTGKKKSKKKQNLTPYQGKHRTFGEFSCPECDREWHSAYSWANKGQECVVCEIIVYPHTQHPLKRGRKNNQKPHLTEYCEMCQDLGYSCLQLERRSKKLAYK